MSEQNIETVRRAYEAYDRRDIVGLQTLSHDECVVYSRAWIENEDDVWESVRIEDLDLRDLADDRVFTSAVARVRGRQGVALQECFVPTGRRALPR
jgi:hypothetical protein